MYVRVLPPDFDQRAFDLDDLANLVFRGRVMRHSRLQRKNSQCL
jgi:hypothetical protein